MKKSFLFIAGLFLLMGVWSCSSESIDEPTPEKNKQEQDEEKSGKNEGKEDPFDDGYCIDYAPVIFEVLVLNSNGENVLETGTPGNVLDKEMYLLLEGERYDLTTGRPEDSFFPHPVLTRDYMPMWYGAFISPYWYQDSDLPDRDNRLFIGEFPGDIKGTVAVELFVGNNHFTLSYTNEVIEKLEVERHYYLDGKEIESGIITLVL